MLGRRPASTALAATRCSVGTEPRRQRATSSSGGRPRPRPGVDALLGGRHRRQPVAQPRSIMKAWKASRLSGARCRETAPSAAVTPAGGAAPGARAVSTASTAWSALSAHDLLGDPADRMRHRDDAEIGEPLGLRLGLGERAELVRAQDDGLRSPALPAPRRRGYSTTCTTLSRRTR